MSPQGGKKEKEHHVCISISSVSTYARHLLGARNSCIILVKEKISFVLLYPGKRQNILAAHIHGQRGVILECQSWQDPWKSATPRFAHCNHDRLVPKLRKYMK